MIAVVGYSWFIGGFHVELCMPEKCRTERGETVSSVPSFLDLDRKEQFGKIISVVIFAGFISERYLRSYFLSLFRDYFLKELVVLFLEHRSWNFQFFSVRLFMNLLAFRYHHNAHFAINASEMKYHWRNTSRRNTPIQSSLRSVCVALKLSDQRMISPLTNAIWFDLLIVFYIGEHYLIMKLRWIAAQREMMTAFVASTVRGEVRHNIPFVRTLYIHGSVNKTSVTWKCCRQ